MNALTCFVFTAGAALLTSAAFPKLGPKRSDGNSVPQSV